MPDNPRFTGVFVSLMARYAYHKRMNRSPWYPGHYIDYAGRAHLVLRVDRASPPDVTAALAATEAIRKAMAR